MWARRWHAATITGLFALFAGFAWLLVAATLFVAFGLAVARPGCNVEKRSSLTAYAVEDCVGPAHRMAARRPGVVQIGDLVHVLLLVGLMLFVPGALKARDAAAARGRDVSSGKS
jgi:hypothetical protein